MIHQKENRINLSINVKWGLKGRLPTSNFETLFNPTQKKLWPPCMSEREIASKGDIEKEILRERERERERESNTEKAAGGR